MTICSWNRECIFGEIHRIKVGDPEMILNEFGKIVRDEWMKSALIRKEIEICAFVVMPNHLHGIVAIRGWGDRPVAPTVRRPGPKPKSISSFLAGFKAIVTKRINEFRQSPGVPVWQRNYFERIIRNDIEYDRIRNYIVNNPRDWQDDEDNPDNFECVDRKV